MSGIFISYRRSASKHLARLIFEKLRARDYDVFLDVTTIDSGEFDRIILNQIAARPHFLLILSSGSLERCVNEGDWLRREIEEAFRLKRNIVPIFDEGFNIEQERQYLPEPIRSALPRLNAPPYSHYYFDAFIDTICNRFLKQPAYEIVVTPTPIVERQEVDRRIEQAVQTPSASKSPFEVVIPPVSIAKYQEIETQTEEAIQTTPTPHHLSSFDIMPQPFAWIKIPSGKITLSRGRYVPSGKVTWGQDEYVPEGGKTFTVKAFEIAKYPVTNAQFAKFMEASGYDNQNFWTADGWRVKVDNQWTEPRYWQDKKWNGANYPVCGISWYEAMAFCLYLSDITDEKILLPTERQWQRAAQGDDGRAYPWGKDWDASKCNNSVGKDWQKNGTSPVTQYENKGDSFFGVVDMSGNVWEWCLTIYESGRSDTYGEGARVLRGGAWYFSDTDYFRTANRDRNFPIDRYDNIGFRLARS
jgi:formylglycine-generating enzyme required for sulfatase activity